MLTVDLFPHSSSLPLHCVHVLCTYFLLIHIHSCLYVYTYVCISFEIELSTFAFPLYYLQTFTCCSVRSCRGLTRLRGGASPFCLRSPSRRVRRQFDAVKSPTVQLWYASNADPRCFKIVFPFPRVFLLVFVKRRTPFRSTNTRLTPWSEDPNTTTPVASLVYSFAALLFPPGPRPAPSFCVLKRGWWRHSLCELMSLSGKASMSFLRSGGRIGSVLCSLSLNLDSFATYDTLLPARVCVSVAERIFSSS